MTANIKVLADGGSYDIEYEFVGSDNRAKPLIIFLHEGLGSVSMWRDFPARLCDALGCRGLVYSRPGYGQSTPREANEKWGVNFMHVHAREVLPALLDALRIDVFNNPPHLFGHSDGGSIALIHAASFPKNVASIIVAAPHTFVEKLSVDSIAKTRDVYLNTDLKSKLSRHHRDPDSAFWGWNDIWLDPAFLAWDINALLPNITCPVLAIQGMDDEYGTMAQIDNIAAALPAATLLKLASCGHSPHRDQPDAVINAVRQFLEK
ncbi:MAG TPA: alpha/beta hydrolase [Casimicrobium sp.]|nr:alpha/beta hydrolase [Casimicrobium sp.]